MRDVGPSGDANSGESASDGPPPSEPPPSSSRGFIGTNINAAQAYVPPTALPETPEPPAPNAKVALSDNVDPRKAPTYPNLKKAAQSIASEMASEIASERPPPIIEAPPDSQSSGIRRGAGYAPSRDARQSLSRSGSFLPPAALRPVAEPPQRNTPVKPMPKFSARPSTATETVETPAQRRAALALIFLFAALLAVAVYFFLRRAPPSGRSLPQPTGGAATPSGAQAAPPSSSGARSNTPAPSISAAADPPSEASAPPSGASSPSPATTAAISRGTGSEAPSDAPGTPSSSSPSPAAATTPAPSVSASATPAPTGAEKPKTERWF